MQYCSLPTCFSFSEQLSEAVNNFNLGRRRGNLVVSRETVDRLRVEDREPVRRYLDARAMFEPRRSAVFAPDRGFRSAYRPPFCSFSCFARSTATRRRL